MMNKRKTFLACMATAVLSIGMVSCAKDEPVVGGGEEKTGLKGDFVLAYASGSGSEQTVYLRAYDDLSQGDISMKTGMGWKLVVGRTSHLDIDKKTRDLYSLRYTQDIFDHVRFGGKDNDDFTFVSGSAGIDGKIALKSSGYRFAIASAEYGSAHTVKNEAVDKNDLSKGVRTLVTIGLLNLKTMTFDKQALATEVEMPELAKQGIYISRIDGPTVSGNKIYYGAALTKMESGKKKGKSLAKTSVLMLDYPELTNPKLIVYDKELGSTNGYRMRSLDVTENGEVLVQASGSEITILKMKEGKFLNYEMPVGKTLKAEKGVSAPGMVYCGNGIVFIPFEDKAKPQTQNGVSPDGEPTYASPYGICRVDLNKKTAIRMETPEGLWLRQYQNARVKDGKIYWALAPVGKEGAVYIYDINSESSKGVKGATFKSGADQYFTGIY